jgi:dihydroorotate dehydrogenase (fumarate)
MKHLETKYLGLSLKNPIIIGSSGLTSTLDMLRRCEDAQAGAVVLRSVFEDEVRIEMEQSSRDHLDSGTLDALLWRPDKLASSREGERYLNLVQSASNLLDIPVIASVSCHALSTWGQYANELSQAGADAIEVNLHELSASVVRTAETIEETYLMAVRAVKANTSVPVAVKLPQEFTNLARLAFEVELEGADSLVFFTRPFLPDFDIDKIDLKRGVTLSQPSDYKPSLRWIALLYGRLNAQLCAAGGVHDGQTIVKQILAGATTVQVVSALYRMDMFKVGQMLDFVSEWMDKHGFASLEAFRGKLSQPNSDDPYLYEKTQYTKMRLRA